MIIKLNQNKELIIDDEDYYIISKHHWTYRGVTSKTSNLPYVSAHTYVDGKRTTIRVHRLIMKPQKGMQVDHINHNTLDNRKCNLRVCTPTQNRQNCYSRVGNSEYKGVSFHKRIKKFMAYIRVNKVLIHLGYFVNGSDAAIAYNIAAKKYFGEYALLNKVPASCAI